MTYIMLYNFAAIALFMIFLPYIAVKLAYPYRRKEWLQRLGFSGSLPPGRYMWVHCASVGEVNLSEAFIHRLKKEFKDHKIVLSVITPAGRKVALKKNLPVEKIFFLPLDLPFIIHGTVKKINPEMLFLAETELWPNLIDACYRINSKTVLVNGRISNRSFGNYRFFKHFTAGVLRKMDLFLVREEMDGKRLVFLGASPNKVFTTGNMKYDSVAVPGAAAGLDRRSFGFKDTDKIFVAGSVREGEEKKVIGAYAEASAELAKKGIVLKSVIAPRHTNRTVLVEKLLKSKNIPYVRKSSLTGTAGSAREAGCVILDTHGELAGTYSVADIVFVGGSLVKKGGQNIIEPAILGKPVIFGPDMSNFIEPAGLLKKSGAAIEVRNREELSEKIAWLAVNRNEAEATGRKARSAVLSMGGVIEKNIGHIKKLYSGLRYPENDIRQILIVQPSRIGDVIFSLPVLVV